MKKLFPLVLLISSAHAFAGEDAMFAEGEKLHNEKCTACHTSEVYTRPDHRVKNMEDLSFQVENCMKGPAKANWTAQQTKSVIHFLNVKYYKF